MFVCVRVCMREREEREEGGRKAASEYTCVYLLTSYTLTYDTRSRYLSHRRSKSASATLSLLDFARIFECGAGAAVDEHCILLFSCCDYCCNREIAVRLRVSRGISTNTGLHTATWLVDSLRDA